MIFSAFLLGAAIMAQGQGNAPVLYMACEKDGNPRSITQVFSVRSGWAKDAGGDRGFELEKIQDYERSFARVDLMYNGTFSSNSITGQFAAHAKSLGDPYGGNCVVTTERARIESWYRQRMADGRYETQSLAGWRPADASFVDVATWENIGTLKAATGVAPKSTPVSGPTAATEVSAPAQPRRDEDEADLASTKAENEAQLAAHRKQMSDFERAKQAEADRHAANRAAAEASLAKYEAERTAHAEQALEASLRQAEWAMRVAGKTSPADEQPVEFKEGVVLCKSTGPDTKTFSCQGPLQNVSTPLETASTPSAIGMACGSSKSIRDLGMVAGYRAFGCGFGIHPTARDFPGNTDVAAKLGVDYIPGRGRYTCPKTRLAYCR